ncbi:hypothetical protein RCH33_1890 [Flavobacterium daejeonense]|nr:hypothetical protein RCH33_1890 [Flavobacterium daejeonense]
MYKVFSGAYGLIGIKAFFRINFLKIRVLKFLNVCFEFKKNYIFGCPKMYYKCANVKFN